MQDLHDPDVLFQEMRSPRALPFGDCQCVASIACRKRLEWRISRNFQRKIVGKRVAISRKSLLGSHSRTPLKRNTVLCNSVGCVVTSKG